MKIPELSTIKPLKCEKVTSYKVDYSDFERYLQDLTGKRISIPAILECGNDTDHDFYPGEHPDWMDPEDQKDAEAFLFGDAKTCPTYHFSDLLETMVIHKLLEPGNYTIHVSW
jgi:hypothetical protein